MERVLDGQAPKVAKITDDGGTEVLGQGCHLRHRAALPDTIADVDKGTLGFVKGTGNLLQVAVRGIAGSHLRHTALYNACVDLLIA